MVSNPGVAAKMFEAIYDLGVSIKMVTTSPKFACPCIIAAEPAHGSCTRRFIAHTDWIRRSKYSSVARRIVVNSFAGLLSTSHEERWTPNKPLACAWDGGLFTIARRQAVAALKEPASDQVEQFEQNRRNACSHKSGPRNTPKKDNPEDGTDRRDQR